MQRVRGILRDARSILSAVLSILQDVRNSLRNTVDLVVAVHPSKKRQRIEIQQDAIIKPIIPSRSQIDGLSGLEPQRAILTAIRRDFSGKRTENKIWTFYDCFL